MRKTDCRTPEGGREGFAIRNVRSEEYAESDKIGRRL